MNTRIEKFDRAAIMWMRRNGDTFGRLALFMIFFWFGILKVFLLSPAGPLVDQLLNVTFLTFIPNDTFQILFGLFEMLIGVLVLFKSLERIALCAACVSFNYHCHATIPTSGCSLDYFSNCSNSGRAVYLEKCSTFGCEYCTVFAFTTNDGDSSRHRKNSQKKIE